MAYIADCVVTYPLTASLTASLPNTHMLVDENLSRKSMLVQLSGSVAIITEWTF